MNKMYEFVATQLIDCERRAIIADYDKWKSTGVLRDSLLRAQAQQYCFYMYGDAEYLPPLYDTMKGLYMTVCRFYADKYLNETRT